jgi:hypothetical protein
MVTSRSRRLSVVFILSMLLTTGLSHEAVASGSLTPFEFPRTLRAQKVLESQISHMLATSPTFREQCERLDKADKLAVILRLNPALPRTLFRARSSIRRYSSGLFIVSVEVAPGPEQAGWIAHEFEHVLEVIEGKDLRAMARGSKPGVWNSVDGMIETERATVAGRGVLYETQTVDASDKFVE